MTLEEFLGQYKDAKNARNTALEKVKAALEELSAAETHMDAVMSLFPEGTAEGTIDAFDFAQMGRTSFDGLFAPARATSKFFGVDFGDLF